MSKRNVHLLPTPPVIHREGYQSHRQFRPDEATAIRDIDQTDPFRFGFPNPLPALPLETHAVRMLSPICKQFDTIEYDVNAILRQREILRPHATFVQRSEPDEEPTENDYTILISATKDDTMASNEAWFHAVNDIAGLLLDRELQFCIELMDPRAVRKNFLSEVGPELTEAWSHSRINVLGTLGNGPEWRTMSLINRGSTQESSVPTVSIGVTKAASHEWQKAKFEAVCAILSPWEVDVALFRSSFWFVNKKPHFELDQIRLNHIHPGNSIGSSGQADTLGGHVTILYQGHKYVMGLTSSHAIEADEMTYDERALGLSPDLSRTRPEVRAPSDLEMEAAVREWECQIRALREELFGAENSEDIDGSTIEQGLIRKLEESTESAKPILTILVRDAFNRLERVQGQIDAAKAFPRDFGTVFASSGTSRYHGEEQIVWDNVNKKNIKTGNAIDWALINVKASRIGNNATPNHPMWERYMYLPFDGTKQIVNAATEEPVCGDYIFKKGPRGHTVGRVNAFKACINRSHGDRDSRFYRVIEVIGPGGIDFPGPGDSGCWGLDKCAFLTAMGIGGEKEANAGFMVPIAWIYADIEKRTGARIPSPVLSPGVVRMMEDDAR